MMRWGLSPLLRLSPSAKPSNAYCYALGARALERLRPDFGVGAPERRSSSIQATLLVECCDELGAPLDLLPLAGSSCWNPANFSAMISVSEAFLHQHDAVPLCEHLIRRA